MKTRITLLVTSLVLVALLGWIGKSQCQSVHKESFITGRITDQQTKLPIQGVQVAVEHSKTTTLSDANGNYRISASVGQRLVFSAQGYESVTLITQKNRLDVTLSPTAISYLAPQPESSTVQAPPPMPSIQISPVEEYEISSGYMMAEEKTAPAPKKASKSIAVTSDVLHVVRNSASIISLGYDEASDESYGTFVENRFKSPQDEPLSTFSVDVDAASYSNMRRFINQGQAVPKDAVRVEELINYFSYDYAKPTGDTPVRFSTEVGECPWNTNHRLVRIGVKAREIASEKLPASNFVFLIDVSGSMYGPTRLELVKSSLKLLVNNLREEDRVAIVVYAGAAGEVLPSTPGSDKQKIREALDQLTAGGSTAGGAGIQLAYRIARKNFIANGNNRIILCTDGDFNVGVSSNQGLESLIETERKSGVFLSILGYGMGNYKDDKMQTLAQKGNGNHAYIDNLQEANKVLVNEFGSTLYTVAKDVKLQIEFNPGKVQAYRLVGYESRLLNKEDFNDDTKDAGELGAGHTVTAFYEVIPIGAPALVDDLKYQPQQNSPTTTYTGPEMLTVKLRYKLPNEDTSRKIENPLVDSNNQNNSADFRFAASVAMFGQLLTDSDFKGTASYDTVISLAKSALGEDPHGYRREFVRLAETAKGMAGNE